MSHMKPFRFTCRECGNHVFIVVHKYYLVTKSLRILKCRCGNGPDGVAAQHTDVRVEEAVEWGPLDEEYGWEYKARNIEEVSADRVESYTYCPACAHDAEESAWETLDRSSDSEQHEFYVFCEVCEREIEFGWTDHSEDGPRIRPVDSRDFDPSQCTPEPRYMEYWKNQGWVGNPFTPGSSPPSDKD